MYFASPADDADSGRTACAEGTAMGALLLVAVAFAANAIYAVFRSAHAPATYGLAGVRLGEEIALDHSARRDNAPIRAITFAIAKLTIS